MVKLIIIFKQGEEDDNMKQLIGTFTLKTKEEILNLIDWEMYRYGKSLRHPKRGDYVHRTSYHMLGEKVDVYWVECRYINGYDIVPHGTLHSLDSTEIIYCLSDYVDLVKDY